MGSENAESWLTKGPFLFLRHRFNCGTGVAIIVSETKIRLGGWHTVTLHRDGLNGLLRLNNDTPVTGRSQVSVSLVPCPSPGTHRSILRGPLQRAEADLAGRRLRMGRVSWRTRAAGFRCVPAGSCRSGHDRGARPSRLPKRRTESAGIAVAVQERVLFPQGHQSQGRGRSPHECQTQT